MRTSWREVPLPTDELAGFTVCARKALQLANQEAQRLSHDCVGTEHLFLGVLKDGRGVAAQVLQGLGLNLRDARSAVEKVSPLNLHQPQTGRLLAMIPLVGPCCLLGIPFGIWALIVLLRPHVRNAFV